MKIILIFCIFILIISCGKKEFKANIKSSEDFINEEIKELEKMDARIKTSIVKDQAFQKEINSDNEKLNKAKGLRYDKKYKEALKLFIELEKTNPNNVSIMEDIIKLTELLDDDETKKYYCERILKIDENNVIASQYMAQMHAKNNKNITALTYYEKLLKNSPDSITYQNIAVMYSKNGMQQKAIKLLNKSIKLDDNSENNYQLAIIYKKINDSQNYIKYLEKSINRKNPKEETYLLLSREYINTKKYDLAIKNLERLKNKNITAYKLLAYSYQESRNYNKAIKYYNDYLKQKPDDMEMTYNLAISYYYAKNYPKFKELAKLYQKNPKSMVNSKNLKQLLSQIK